MWIRTVIFYLWPVLGLWVVLGHLWKGNWEQKVYYCLSQITVRGFTSCHWNTLRQIERGWKISNMEWINRKEMNFLFSLLPADVQLLRHQNPRVVGEVFMNDLLFLIVASGGATKLGWRQQQLVCLSGILGVMAVICWTGGNRGGPLRSHHLVPVTCHRDWYKSNSLSNGGLKKTNWCFKARERKCQRWTVAVSLPEEQGVIPLLGLNAERGGQQVALSMGP